MAKSVDLEEKNKKDQNKTLHSYLKFLFLIFGVCAFYGQNKKSQWIEKILG